MAGWQFRLQAVSGHVLGAADPCAKSDEAENKCAKHGDKVTLKVKARTQDNDDVSFFENDRVVVEIGSIIGLLQPSLGEAAIGLKTGDVKGLTIEAKDMAHPAPVWDSSLVVQLPVGSAHVKKGQTVQVRHFGEERLAVILDVSDDERIATCDLNDPIAGKTLQLRVVLEAIGGDLEKRVFPEPKHVPDRVFSLAELSHHDGRHSPDLPLLLSVRGLVYDVSAGAEFYGPGKPYGHMAGKDCTVALAKFSLDPRWLNQRWVSLDDAEEGTLLGYLRTFQAKYVCVGRLADGAL